MQSMIDKTFAPGPRHAAARLGRGGAIVRRHLLGVINDILDFSKIESGHLELEAVDFSLVDTAEEALAMFAHPAAAKGIELAIQCLPPNSPLAVRGDPFQLRQVISNLVSNAIKFTDDGEVIACVELVHQTADDATVRISVRDTGVGIAPEMAKTIFEHFAQADRSTTRRYGGTGLGLAICRRLLALMDGNIRVESQIGHGSTFIVDLRLPLARSPDVAPLPIAELEAVRVLIVDDNQTFEGGESKAIVRAVLAMAKSVGMQVTAEGVESLEQALLLKTLGCDYLQGFRFSRPIREPAIPAIFSQHWPLELPPPLTIAQALVGQRTAETASPNPAYHNAVLTA
jgi:anti-sigma regulatory factor (Ser/Thr protein kinase)